MIGNDSGNYPTLMNDDNINSDGTMFLRRMQSVDADTIIHLIFDYAEKGYSMPDVLSLDCRAVFSKKIYDVLKDVPIKDFQLVSTIIKGKKGEEYSDYWIAGVYRDFAFLDKDKSKYMSITSKGRWSGIEKMVIDEKLMSEVPLEERLIYVSKESSAYVFYHKSIVDLIKSVNPEGIAFTKVEVGSDSE
jgi:hypothetical protein